MAMAVAFPIPLFAPVIMKERPTMDTSRSFAAKLLEAFSNPDLHTTSSKRATSDRLHSQHETSRAVLSSFKVCVLTQFLNCYVTSVDLRQCWLDKSPDQGPKELLCGMTGHLRERRGLNRAYCDAMMTDLKLRA